MHGVIFTELEKYVKEKFGKAAWSGLLQEAKLGPKIYLATAEYPDEEVVAIVTAAVKATGKPAGVILEDFGEFIVPDLVKMFQMAIKPEWRTLDFLENTEHTIHKMVRLKNPGAEPPQLVTQRTHPTEVVITYTSKRRLCAVAKGIVRGVAKHYKEKITISEPTCMLTGGSRCTINVRLQK
jgi:predicted hydrocarbon binding protein